MKIVADEQIPYLTDFFGAQNELIILPEKNITAHTVHNADALLIRSVTPVNNALISNSSIRFIGSATAGIDHMDTMLLDEAHIAWAYTPGCNANAVADYVLFSVAHLIQAGIFQKAHLTAGVIGVGNVGRQVANTLTRLGFEVILNDPPRHEIEVDFTSTPLDAFYDLDFICLHTPLITTGNHPTTHLINATFLSQLNPNCVLLNAGRGACIDNHALKQYSFPMVLDVWELEPTIDTALATSALIATPHIAGHSQPAKYRATEQLFKAFSNHFETDHYTKPEENPSEYKEIDVSTPDWVEQAIKIENLNTLSQRFQDALHANPNKTSNTFKQCRQNYLFRPEVNCCRHT